MIFPMQVFIDTLNDSINLFIPENPGFTNILNTNSNN